MIRSDEGQISSVPHSLQHVAICPLRIGKFSSRGWDWSMIAPWNEIGKFCQSPARTVGAVIGWSAAGEMLGETTIMRVTY